MTRIYRPAPRAPLARPVYADTDALASLATIRALNNQFRRRQRRAARWDATG